MPTGGSAGGGEGGNSGAQTLVPVDDLEDGDLLTMPVFGARGVWYTVNDGSGAQFPGKTCNTSVSADDGSTHASRFAMHTYGSGFVGLGYQQFAQLGITFRSLAPACTGPLDVSRMTGVRFWAKGAAIAQLLKLSIGTVATNPASDGGTCESNCYQMPSYEVAVDDQWREYFVPFVQTTGGSAPLDPSQLLNLIWQVATSGSPGGPQAACFDFWIDDVAFYVDG